LQSGGKDVVNADGAVLVANPFAQHFIELLGGLRVFIGQVPFDDEFSFFYDVDIVEGLAYLINELLPNVFLFDQKVLKSFQLNIRLSREARDGVQKFNVFDDSLQIDFCDLLLEVSSVHYRENAITFALNGGCPEAVRLKKSNLAEGVAAFLGIKKAEVEAVVVLERLIHNFEFVVRQLRRQEELPHYLSQTKVFSFGPPALFN
jgi:hypothetical protein